MYICNVVLNPRFTALQVILVVCCMYTCNVVVNPRITVLGGYFMSLLYVHM